MSIRPLLLATVFGASVLFSGEVLAQTNDGIARAPGAGAEHRNDSGPQSMAHGGSTIRNPVRRVARNDDAEAARRADRARKLQEK